MVRLVNFKKWIYILYFLELGQGWIGQNSVLIRKNVRSDLSDQVWAAPIEMTISLARLFDINI